MRCECKAVSTFTLPPDPDFSLFASAISLTFRSTRVQTRVLGARVVMLMGLLWSVRLTTLQLALELTHSQHSEKKHPTHETDT